MLPIYLPLSPLSPFVFPESKRDLEDGLPSRLSHCYATLIELKTHIKATFEFKEYIKFNGETHGEKGTKTYLRLQKKYYQSLHNSAYLFPHENIKFLKLNLQYPRYIDGVYARPQL